MVVWSCGSVIIIIIIYNNNRVCRAPKRYVQTKGLVIYLAHTVIHVMRAKPNVTCTQYYCVALNVHKRERARPPLRNLASHKTSQLLHTYITILANIIIIITNINRVFVFNTASIFSNIL